MAEILVEYDGNFADSLAWQQANLDRFAEKSDLRTDIFITRGENRPQINATNLGDILVWKGIGNPRDLFRKDTLTGEEVTVSTNFWQGEAVIYLHDQVITQNIMQRTKGRIDERLYADQANTLSKKGLMTVLAQEKQRQILNAMIIDGGYAGLMTFSAAVTYLGFIIIKNAPFTNLLGQMNPDPIFQIFIRSAELLYGIGLPATCAKGLLDIFGDLRSFPSPPGRYFHSKWDLNPLKHVKSFSEGNIYLSTKGREIVSVLPNTT